MDTSRRNLLKGVGVGVGGFVLNKIAPTKEVAAKFPQTVSTTTIPTPILTPARDYPENYDRDYVASAIRGHFLNITDRIYLDIIRPVKVRHLYTFIQDLYDEVGMMTYPIMMEAITQNIFRFIKEEVELGYNSFSNMREAGVIYGKDEFFCFVRLQENMGLMRLNGKEYKNGQVLRFDKNWKYEFEVKTHEEHQWEPIDPFAICGCTNVRAGVYFIPV